MKQQLDSWISTPDLLESWNSATFLLEKKYPAFFMGAAGIQDFRENKKERAGIKDSRERITCLKKHSHSDDDAHLKSRIPNPLKGKQKQIAWNPGNQVLPTIILKKTRNPSVSHETSSTLLKSE
jgi:hypothetical protein